MGAGPEGCGRPGGIGPAGPADRTGLTKKVTGRWVAGRSPPAVGPGRAGRTASTGGEFSPSPLK